LQVRERLRQAVERGNSLENELEDGKDKVNAVQDVEL
jgi:hypothetical protein